MSEKPRSLKLSFDNAEVAGRLIDWLLAFPNGAGITMSVLDEDDPPQPQEEGGGR